MMKMKRILFWVFPKGCLGILWYPFAGILWHRFLACLKRMPTFSTNQVLNMLWKRPETISRNVIFCAYEYKKLASVFWLFRKDAMAFFGIFFSVFQKRMAMHPFYVHFPSVIPTFSVKFSWI